MTPELLFCLGLALIWITAVLLIREIRHVRQQIKRAEYREFLKSQAIKEAAEVIFKHYEDKRNDTNIH